MQKRSSSTSKTDNMSEQYRKMALKYRRHAAGDWIDEDSTEKELIRKAMDIISIGDQPLISMQRDSLEDIIIALGSQRDDMVRLLAKINDAFSKKQKSLGGKDKQMRVREVTENIAGGTARKVHLAGQLAEKMGQMVDVNKRFIEEQQKEIKELNEELKVKEAGKIHEKIRFLNQQIEEMFLKIEQTKEEVLHLKSKGILQQDDVILVGDSGKTILKEGEVNLQKAKELNKKLQERNMKVDSDIISKQMEILQLEEVENQIDDNDIDNINNNNNKLRNVSREQKKQSYQSKGYNSQISQANYNNMIQDLNKKLSEKTQRKEVLEKQLSANEQLTTVNVRRYEELLCYLESKGRQNDILIEQFDKAMDNASQHLLRVSQLASALDEQAFKQAFPMQFKLVKQPGQIRLSPKVSMGQSYWEINRQQQRNEMLQGEQGQKQDQRRQLEENQKKMDNGQSQQKQQEIFDGYESDNLSQPKYSKNSSESDRNNRQVGQNKLKQRSISGQEDDEQEGQQGQVQVDNSFKNIAKNNPSEVIKQQQVLLQQLQLQLLEQTKQSELLQQQLQQAQQEQQQQQQQQQQYYPQGESEERIDMDSVSGSEEQFEDQRNGRLKLPKIVQRQGQQQMQQQVNNQYEQKSRQQQQQQPELTDKYRSPSVYQSNHPKYTKIQNDYQSRGQSGRSQSVSQPSYQRNLRLSSLASQQQVISEGQDYTQIQSQTDEQISSDKRTGESPLDQSVSVFGQQQQQQQDNPMENKSNIKDSKNENNFTFAKNDPSSNTSLQMNTISSIKNEYPNKEIFKDDNGDGSGGGQSGNSSFQLDIRRNSSQKRMLRRKNHNTDSQGMDQILSLIDASSNIEKDNQGQDSNNNSNSNNNNNIHGNDINTDRQTTTQEIYPIKTTQLPSPILAAENSNINTNKQIGQPGTSSSFSSVVREVTEKRLIANHELKRGRGRGQQQQDEENKSIGNTIQSDGRRDEMNESHLTKYMNRSLNEQALSYKPKGQKSWKDLNSSYGVIRGVTTPKIQNSKLNNISADQIKENRTQPDQEQQDESRSELNDSLIGRHRNVSEDQEERKGDNKQDKDKTNGKDKSSRVQNRLVDSAVSRQPQKDHSENQQMKSSLTNFIKKQIPQDTSNEHKDLSSYSGFTDNPKEIRSNSNKPSKEANQCEQDQTQERLHQIQNEDNNNSSQKQQKKENSNDNKVEDDKEKDRILRELAEERNEKQKLKDMLRQQEIEKEMLLKKLQDQQKPSGQNIQHTQTKDRRLSRGKVTWKDSEKSQVNNKIREFGDDPALRYICVQREDEEEEESEQKDNEQLGQSQSTKHGKNNSPKSSLKWRRAEQLQPQQQIQLIYPQQLERQSYDSGQRGSSNGNKRQVQKQGQSQQQSAGISEFVNFVDAKKELKIINSSVQESNGNRSNSNTMDRNGMQKSSLRNKIEKSQMNIKKQVA